MIFNRSRLDVCPFLQSPCDDSVLELRVTPWLKFQRCGPCPLVHCQGLSLSLHLLFKHFTLSFIAAESFGFALAERLTRILLLTTNKSHVLGVPISNFWGPAQYDFFMGYHSVNEGYRSVISAQLGVPLSN